MAFAPRTTISNKHLAVARHQKTAASPTPLNSIHQQRRRMQFPVAATSAAASAPQDVQQQVAEWLRLDADAASRAKVQAMLDSQSYAELRELMCQRLEFGEFVGADSVSLPQGRVLVSDMAGQANNPATDLCGSRHTLSSPPASSPSTSQSTPQHTTLHTHNINHRHCWPEAEDGPRVQPHEPRNNPTNHPRPAEVPAAAGTTAAG